MEYCARAVGNGGGGEEYGRIWGKIAAESSAALMVFLRGDARRQLARAEEMWVCFVDRLTEEEF